MKFNIEKIKIDALLFGTFVGLLSPVIAFFVFYYFNISRFGNLSNYIDMMVGSDIFTKVISICAVPNLLFFYLFLNKGKELAAKGVIFATLIITIIVLMIKFM